MIDNSLFDLSGKVAVVTGATKGIGKAIAEALAAFGARVVISSRKEAMCETVADEIIDAGGEALAVPCNISDTAHLRHLVDRTLDHWEQIDVLVCNAAVNPHFGPLAEIPEEAYDKIMDTNVKSNLWLCNMVIPQMAERKDGVVIIVSSIGGLKGHGKLGAYALSKAADMQLARNLAVEWGRANVRVNCIAPGLVRTDMARALWEDDHAYAQAMESYPLGRIGEPEDIAGAAVFLASRAGAWTTGQSLIVDGGVTIMSGRYT
ncbi:MAG: SDR family oxidoreductase [Rhodospirillales bacterium]|nr:SDR family oxidoreductase [Rhodospirillales bacterium]MDH3912035.1 SDR family oxidoreductase [Rhodospirillales bacterium]MDH3919737.1 SDR family oxidoreductase [Rhodospirillales bacterium]MDH3967662.1 SDR family oxidoreductase [Rhodospirillales bacterium]